MPKRLTPELKQKLNNLHNATAENLIDELGDLRKRQKALKEEEELIKTVLEPKLKSAKEFNPNTDIIRGQKFDLQVIKTTVSRFNQEKAKEFLTPEQIEQCYVTSEMTQYRTHRRDEPTEEHPAEQVAP